MDNKKKNNKKYSAKNGNKITYETINSYNIDINKPLMLTEVFHSFNNRQTFHTKPLIFTQTIPEFKNKPR